MTRPRLRSREGVLTAIRHLTEERSMPPTISELRRKLKVGSTRTVLRYLRDLEESGFVRRWSGARGLKILEEVTMSEQALEIANQIVSRFNISMSRDALIPLRDAIKDKLESTAKERDAEIERWTQRCGAAEDDLATAGRTIELLRGTVAEMQAREQIIAATAKSAREAERERISEAVEAMRQWQGAISLREVLAAIAAEAEQK